MSARDSGIRLRARCCQTTNDEVRVIPRPTPFKCRYWILPGTVYELSSVNQDWKKQKSVLITWRETSFTTFRYEFLTLFTITGLVRVVRKGRFARVSVAFYGLILNSHRRYLETETKRAFACVLRAIDEFTRSIALGTRTISRSTFAAVRLMNNISSNRCKRQTNQTNY